MESAGNFNLMESPLEGTNLIEASAGTGKTHTITGLVLRLVLEKRLSINEILVVTFTEAATNELKERIRNMLRQAIGAFSGERMGDALLDDLVKKTQDHDSALKTLNEALMDFDKAAVFTIHGFCRRVLYENAFESGSLFDTELITGQESLLKEIVDDFWRKHFYKESPLFVNYAINNRYSPQNFLSLLSNGSAQPYLKIVPQVEIPDSSCQERRFKLSLDELCKAWHSARLEVEKMLVSDKGLNRNRYRKNNIPIWIRGMDHYVASRRYNPLLFNGFKKFTTNELKVSTKKGCGTPVHPIFKVCEGVVKAQEALKEVFERRLIGLKAALFRYTKDELVRKKEENNIQFFDDLLFKLHGALEGNGGEDLARALRVKFRAALIDEFQDTDTIQYDIFKKIFDVEGNILFFIGDPKQAIYSFRGADIFSYIRAKKDVSLQYTLRKNWRSEPDIISAVNAIFANADYPFIYKQVPFKPAEAVEGKTLNVLTLDGQYDAPLHLWFLRADKFQKGGKPITKTLAREVIPGAVAAEIARLLGHERKGGALLGRRPLIEKDIAVLVRTNSEARLMQEALSAIHIPSVLYSTANLFDSHEAMEMQRVLFGIFNPNNERFLRAALTTDMMGIGGEKLCGLVEHEIGLEKWFAKFKEYYDIWNKRGFIQMFRCLLFQENILSRLMFFPDGERRSTNLLHLSEVIHRESVNKNLMMSQVLKWLSEQRDAGAPRLEEHQLRLESDENAIKLVTIHKSKGLEYPVVFCPFAWEGSRIDRSKNVFTFHDEADDMRLTLDLGSKQRDEHRVFAEREVLAENLRLLYVALTRAKSRCYLLWGRFRGSGTSALAYLFHHPQLPEDEDILGDIEKKFMGLDDKDVLLDLEHVVNKSSGSIMLSEMPLRREKKRSPMKDKNVALVSRKYSGAVDRKWHISSFSSLISPPIYGDELPGRDAIRMSYSPDQRDLEDSDLEKPPAGIFLFPKGVKSGTCLHDILEHLDFKEKEPIVINELVAEKLNEYGFESRWLETIFDMIINVLSMPLDPDLKGLKLSSIHKKDRLNELEFYFPLKMISPRRLERIFHENGTQAANDITKAELTTTRLQFAPTRGFMRGFIDLVFQWGERFYLVDWKSNFLGSRIEDYGSEFLYSTMEENFYFLQYHIYTLALDQYLRLRLPGYSYKDHFGGVFYVFLRGVDPNMGAGFGVYRDLPSPDLMKALRYEMIEKKLIN